MKITTFFRTLFTDITGYWIYKKMELPSGIFLEIDVKNKLNISIKNIFDVGANVGQTIHYFKKIFPNSEIHSFEPFNSTFQELRRTTYFFTKLTLVNKALGAKKETVYVTPHNSESSALNSLMPENMGSNESLDKEKILVTTLDEYCEEIQINGEIDLLKIDTEGFEIEVLKGADKNLSNVKLIYAEVGFSNTYKRHTPLSTITDYLNGKGFHLFHLYEPNPYLLKQGKHYCNALFVNEKFAPEAIIV